MKKFFRKLRRSILKRIIARPNVFLNPADLNALDVLLDGCWDDQLVRSLATLADESEKSAVLIDIGANIGLISCAIEDHFERIFCFEPNPMAYRALQANVLHRKDPSKYQVFEYGLGDKSGQHTITIPKGNLGGAFIRGKDNHLSEEELDRKEGGKLFAELDLEISIQDFDVTISRVTESLIADHHVVFKIDVEGMESLMIHKIIQSKLWQESEVSIFFECWSPRDVSAISSKTQLLSRTSALGWNLYPSRNTKPDSENKEFFTSNKIANMNRLLHANI